MYAATSTPDVAASYNNIANIYHSTGIYEEALEMLTKSLDNKTSVYGGDNHPDVTASYNGIANVYLATGDLENALVQNQKALEIRARVFGSDHPDVAASIKNIGMV